MDENHSDFTSYHSKILHFFSKRIILFLYILVEDTQDVIRSEDKISEKRTRNNNYACFDAFFSREL